MKIAYLCPFAHVTVINKPDTVFGINPKEVTCTHIGCGCPAGMFPFLMDETVQPTHEFFIGGSEILSLEEQKYLEAGGMLFREIPDQVSSEVKKEFAATKGINKLALFLVNNIPNEERLPDIIDTTILHLQKYLGHMQVMKTLTRDKNNVN